MTITDEKKGLVFKMLAAKPLYEVGIEFGFDKHYKDSTSVKNAVYRIYQQVSQEPEKYYVSQDTLELVKGIVSNRSVASREVSLREKQDDLDNMDFKEILISGRKKAYKLLNAKMDRVSSSKKRLDDVNITGLAQVFGILFDKTQIIQGEATENVAVLAKIDKSISPEDALAMVLKSREINQLDKDRTNKKK